MKIIGHRGARGLARENTLASLAKALRYGVDGVEFDVRVTKDKFAILHHDALLGLSPGRPRVISQTTYKQLKLLRPDLTTLEEALDFLGPERNLYIEIKEGEDVVPIVQILEGRLAKGWSAKNLAVASFDQKILRQIHAKLPMLPLIVNERWSGLRAQIRARQVNTRLISIDQTWLWSGFISAMSKRGYILYTYTLNNPEKAKRWAKYGLAGVVTDYPDRFRKTTR